MAIVAFVVAVAFAYHVDTIITWSLPLVPASLVLSALLGGRIGNSKRLGGGTLLGGGGGGTWSLPHVPASLVLNSLVGGPLIALVGFALARWPVSRAALCGLAAAAFVANTVVYVVLGAWLHPLCGPHRRTRRARSRDCPDALPKPRAPPWR